MTDFPINGVDLFVTSAWNDTMSVATNESSFMVVSKVSKLGFECMGLAGVYNSPLSDEDGISVLKDDFNKGTTRIKNLDENIGSLNVKPSEEELTGISNVNLLKR
ncbi:hypothetical protein NC653_012986 [Populus alba x Populus x berolinensis]|uniref:Uncharacterized protein n=1 Tax=Populus alba x Populus x berolinensis TaxID=444605 RepID=A0AAD6QTC8_9ROSI|nr:hypothetical protein NC653_012986 [Populus alba x Populus x berolinensis]